MAIAALLSEHVDLAPYTTLGLGGPARFFASVGTPGELGACLEWAASHDLAVHILGGGSNTVFADSGYPGIVVHVALSGRRWERDGDCVLATVGGGENWDAFVQACVVRGLGGIECLAGIPGQVGATPIQNVGAYGQEVCQSLTHVRVLDRQGCRELEIAAADCGFAYRWSRFKGKDRDRYVVLSATFRLRRDALPRVCYPELDCQIRRSRGTEKLQRGPAGLAVVREAVLQLRREKSMIVDSRDPESRSVGSFFVNPVLSADELAALRSRIGSARGPASFPVAQGTKISAAWLVEKAGFPRGYAREGVGVSSRHALALVNRGGSSRALLSLARDIQDAVEQRFGIRLHREPVVVPG